MGRKLKQSEHNASIYFRLRDEENWQMIDRLMTLPHYANNRASLINNALSYGLPKLIENEFGEKTLCDEPNEQRAEKPAVQISESDHAERIDEVVRLLQEIIMNTHISKSLICSLFNAKSAELNGKPLSAKKFDSGAMRDTPTCMTKYEIDRLNEMDEED
ncbi:MAG: hypothetical protein K2J83_05400 [Clostridia bacterium]|nr:hypothetical protein [Clostridia bacterium]